MLYFYDLETSGINPKTARIMQFAGQRTDMQLRPIGQPDNYLIRMTSDVLPDPDAILITGITPQQTIADGITEAEFLKIFQEQIAVPGTVFVGFNSIRFDDHFMRYLHYRNFYDPYEWQWRDGRGRWDLLDVVRMTRALRPEGIEWPFDQDGKSGNRLEMLSAANNLVHDAAHDALSDVNATIALAQLLRDKQPKLFEFLLAHRDKKKVASLVSSGQPFVYSSGKYPAEFEKTTVAASLINHPDRQGMFVFDLRHDPEAFSSLSDAELAKLWSKKYDEEGLKLPVKLLKYNSCPAVAPLGVLDEASQQRLSIDLKIIQANYHKLSKMTDFPDKILAALKEVEKARPTAKSPEDKLADCQLYEGFFDDGDKRLMEQVKHKDPSELSGLEGSFKDKRLNQILPLYKARNFPAALENEEREAWEGFREQVLLGGGENSRMAVFFKRLYELGARPTLTSHQKYLLEELQLYAEAILPTVDV